MGTDAVSTSRVQATYGRRRALTPFSDDEDEEGVQQQTASSSSPLKFFDSPPPLGARKRLRVDDADTGHTTPDSSDEEEEESPVKALAGISEDNLTAAQRLVRAMADTDSNLSEDDADADAEVDNNNAAATREGLDAVSRLRAMMGGGTTQRTALRKSSTNHINSAQSLSSDQYTSSLSSAPPLSSDHHRADDSGGFGPSSGSEADGEGLASALLRASKRGATAGRMRKRDGNKIPSSSSGGAPQQATSSRMSGKGIKTGFELSSDEDVSAPVPSSSPSSSLNDLNASRIREEAATQRRQRLADMAAKKRGPSPSLEEEFFGQTAQVDDAVLSQGDDPIRSSSHADDSDTSLPDAREMIRAAEAARMAKADQRDSEQAERQRRKKDRKEKKKKASSSKSDKAVKGPRQLSKKELEEMHKMTAKIERSRPVPSLALQAQPVQRQQYDITHLAAMFEKSHNDDEGQRASLEIDNDPIEVETPRARRLDGEIRLGEAKPSPSNRHQMEYGALETFPPRLPSKPAPASDPIEGEEMAASEKTEEERQQEARIEALRLKKERWLEAQKNVEDRKLVLGSRGPSREDLVESLQVVGKPPLRAKPKPVVGLEATSLFNASLQEKIRKQNLLARSAREAANRQQKSTQDQQASKPLQSDVADDSMDALKRIQERISRQSDQRGSADGGGDEDAESDGDEDDEDFVLHDNVRGSDDEGGGSDEEEEETGANQIGSGSEYDLGEDPMPASSQQAPASSQNTSRSYNSSGRGATRDRVEERDDEDEDEDDDVDVTFTANRKGRASRAVLDDEDVESGEDTHKRSESIEDIDSSREKPSDIISSSSSGLDQPLGLTQFLGGFAPSPIEFSEQPASASETSGKTHDSSSSSLLQVPATAAIVRASSDDSVLGQFFQETQLSEDPRGFSLDVIGATGRARNAENAPFLPASLGGDADHGFSQLFNEGTQMPSALLAASAGGPSQVMGPPTALPSDGFAALRRAAQADAERVDSPSPLPSNDGFDHDDEEEERIAALNQTRSVASSIPTPQRNTPKQYLNREGFFTQTKPSFGHLPSSQSQFSQLASVERDGEAGRRDSSTDDLEESGDGSPRAAKKKRRFRRALQPEDDDLHEEARADSEIQEDEEHPSEQEGEEGDPAGSGSEGADFEEEEGEGDGEGDANALHPGATRNAWDILRQGQARIEALTAAGFKPHSKKRQQDYQFIEGEAEESDEDEEGRRNKKGAGGLDGVFSDSGSDDEDEEDEEDDGRDLEELVDNEREVDEAEKDVLARERFQKDLDADDEAAMALADKAARGELRNKRRLRDGDRLEDLLDDDFDEERLMRKANNPRAMVAKRRKIEGDEMDILAAREESQAFVRGYSETHRADVVEEYNFLAGADSDQEEGKDRESERDSSLSSSEEGSDVDDEDAGEAGQSRKVTFAKSKHGSNDQDDDDDDDEAEAPQRMTRKQLAQEIRERRQRQKQGILSSDDEGAEPSLAKRSRDTVGGEDEDEDEDDYNSSRPGFLRDRLAERKALLGGGKGGHARNQQSSVQGASMTKSNSTSSFFARRQRSSAGEAQASITTGSVEDDGDADSDEDSAAQVDPSVAIQARLLRREATRKDTSAGTAARLAKLAEECRSEPDFTAGRGRSFTAAGSGNGGGGGGGGGSSVTGWGRRPGGAVHSSSSSSLSSSGGQGRRSSSWTEKTAVRPSPSSASSPVSNKRPKHGSGVGVGAESSRPVLGRAILAARRVEESQ